MSYSNSLATAPKESKICSVPREGFFKIHPMRQFQTYITEAVEELRHVRWPTRQQAIRLSIIVIIFTFAASAAFGLIDYALSQVVKILLSFTY